MYLGVSVYRLSLRSGFREANIAPAFLKHLSLLLYDPGVGARKPRECTCLGQEDHSKRCSEVARWLGGLSSLVIHPEMLRAMPAGR